MFACRSPISYSSLLDARQKASVIMPSKPPFYEELLQAISAVRPLEELYWCNTGLPVSGLALSVGSDATFENMMAVFLLFQSALFQYVSFCDDEP